MKLSSKLIATSLGLAMIFGGAVTVGAQTTDISSLVSQIQNLLQQVQALQAQIAELDRQRGALQSELRETINLTRQLRQGMTGDDIEALQEALASDPNIYPEGLITGYFGPLTEKAVKRFQKKNGIEQVGEVGPKTRAAFHAWWGDASTTASALPPGLAKKQVQNTWQLGSTTAYDVTSGKITICHKGKNTITIAIPALSAHLKWTSTRIGSCDGTSGDTTDDGDDENGDNEDTTPPVITNLGASDVASTTATISWDTDEDTTATLWFSTTTPLTTSTAEIMNQSSLSTSHSFDLENLATSTTYYYITDSSDLSGNTATTSESSFSTLSE